MLSPFWIPKSIQNRPQIEALKLYEKSEFVFAERRLVVVGVCMCLHLRGNTGRLWNYKRNQKLSLPIGGWHAGILTCLRLFEAVKVDRVCVCVGVCLCLRLWGNTGKVWNYTRNQKVVFADGWLVIVCMIRQASVLVLSRYAYWARTPVISEGITVADNQKGTAHNTS